MLFDDGWTFSFTPDSAYNLVPFTKNVDLPHDWSVELPFDRNAPAGNDGAYLPTGKGTYVKNIRLVENQLKGSVYKLMFEGVYERSTLKVNGQKVGFRPYGYSSFIYDITPYLRVGDNRIEMEADNSHQKNSRWYSGSGIFRHVRLITTGIVNIDPWSVFVTTPSANEREADINLKFNIENYKDGSVLNANFTITDNTGKVVAHSEEKISSSDINTTIKVINPKLWSHETPDLYQLNIRLDDNGKQIDSYDQSFGIRTIAYSAKDGFRLNGKKILLNGACVHHDNGILGAASYTAAEARKVRLLKEAGFNSVRTSHNPPSPEFLDECDRQGLLVIDEALDGWRDAKNAHDYHLWIDEWGVKDVGDMVRRDRNHPSIIAWSIGNEVIERKKIEVVSTARKFAAECHRLDPTRPVTEALCAWDSDWEIYDPHAEVLDIVGYNYMIHKSETDHERCPDRVMWQTESYPNDAASNWHKVKENPYIIGDFVWTGIDYLGESGIGRFYYKGETPGEHYHRPQWPWHGAYCGDIDITGWRKPISHYREMLYNPQKTLYMAVKEPNGYYGEIFNTQWSVWPSWESWNWKGHEGQPIDVEVMSRYPRVRLYLNNELIGEKDAGENNDCKAVFTLPYAPGTLKAAGIASDGSEAEVVTLSTTGAPVALRLTPDKDCMNADNQDLTYIVVEVVDENGNVVPDAEFSVDFSITGQGKIIGAGSADLKSEKIYSKPNLTTWKGRGLVVVKSTHSTGKITLVAKADKLKGDNVKIKTIKNNGTQHKKVQAKSLQTIKSDTFVFTGNPIVKTEWTADPAPLVYKDRLYLYTGHDEWYDGQDGASGGKEFNITEWMCYSTKDMKTWTSHGSVARPSLYEWADTVTAGVGTAWASQVIEHKGKFYFYHAVRGVEPWSGYAIGVSVADKPTGPFRDAIGKPLISDSMTDNGARGWWNDIDPTVLVDDDGKAYICWGNGTCFMAKLNDDMVSLDPTPVASPLKSAGSPNIWVVNVPRFTEGPWLHKRGEYYYLTYASAGFDHKEAIDYAMSKSIMGPWEHKGQLTGGAENSFTIHPGIAEFKGQNYLFYHNATLTIDGHKGAIGRRSVCVDKFSYNPDGTMTFVNQTK